MFSEVNTTWMDDFGIVTVGRLQMEEYCLLQSPLNGVGGRYWAVAMGRLVVGGCRVVLTIVGGGCGVGGGGGRPPGGGGDGPPAGGGVGRGAPPPPQVAGGGGGP